MTDVAPDDPRLPERLAHAVPPVKHLSIAGSLDALGPGHIRIGIVGSRHPRPDSERHAACIAREAARLGFTVVSGLAIGIDGIAHRAALDAGGSTIAVLGSGLAHVYPRRHLSLARRIAGGELPGGVAAGEHPAARGAVVSEYGAGEHPAFPFQFRHRNRIIAALCDYLVVVQAMESSGSMRTATTALELGVPIGIVPSGPTDPEYLGSLGLIRDGADCVLDGAGLVARMAIHRIIAPDTARAALDRLHEHHQVALGTHPLASILTLPRTVDEVAELAGIDLTATRRLLIELEDDGLVRRDPDGTWTAAR